MSPSFRQGVLKSPFTIIRFFLLSLLLIAPTAQAALTISASGDVNPVRASEYLHVEFTVSNTDDAARTGVVVEMVYPTNLNQVFETEFDGDCGNTSCSFGELVTWTLGTLPAGGSVTLNLPPQVAAGTADGTVISFAPTVTDDSVDTDSATLDLVVDSGALYDLALAEMSDPATAGATLRYQLTFAYAANAAAVNDSTLRFPIPSNTTFVSATDGGTLGAGVVSWDLGFLNPGEGGVREVTVQLGAGLVAGDVVSASAEVLADSTPAENAVAEANTSIAAASGLQIAIESNANPARPNELFNMALTVSNLTAVTRTGVVLTANYPQSLLQLLETSFEGQCGSTTCTAGERVTWTLGDIPAGGSVTVNLAPTISSTTVGGVLLNLHATAADGAGLQARQSDTIRVQDDARYDLSLAENSDPAQAGDTLTYKATFGYRADAVAVSNSTLRLPLPAGTTFVSATGGGTLNGSTVEWALGFLGPGDSGVREATLQLGAGLTNGTVIEATAEVAGVSTAIESARAEANTVIAAGGGLQLAMETNNNPARASELTNLQMTITNHDPFTRFGVELTGNFPQNLLQQFELNFDGDCVSTTCTAGEKMTWLLGNIAAGETVTVTLPAVSTSTVTGGVLIDFFMATEDDQGVQSRQRDTVRVQTDSIYDVSLSENSDPAVAGSTLTYKVTFGYRADAGAVNQTALRFPVPAGATFVSASAGGALSNGVVEWGLGFLSPGDSGEREVTVQLDGGLTNGAVIEAYAEVSSTSAPIEAARAEANTVIAASERLQIAMESYTSPARPSELVNYRITVSNRDGFTRFGVTLTGHFPQNLLQEFEVDFDGDCSSSTCTAGERVTWLLGDIPAGETRSVDLPPDLTSGVLGGVLIDFFTRAQDDQGAQAHQVDTIAVQTDTLYDLAVTENSDPVTPGSSLTYRATYGYRADAGQVNDSMLRLPIPAGATFVSATGGGALANGAVEWALGFLSPGDGGFVEATVALDGALPAGAVIEAAAELFAVNSTDEGARAEANTSVRSSVALALDLNAVTFTAEASRRLNIELTVTNNDPFTRFGVELHARFPESLNQLFESDPDFIGDCGSSTCTAGELITWPLVDLPAGQSVTVTLPPTVASTAIEGDLINFLAWVSDDQGIEARGTAALYTGCIDALDTDCDGISNLIDNCIVAANTPQRDTDGDDYGNRCDADLNNSCIVNPTDLGLFRLVFLSSDPDADFNGDGIVNPTDLGIFRLLFLMPPGPSALTDVCGP